jgi:hypothetical protein
MTFTRVSFIEEPQQILSRLDVESSNQRDLLAAITKALFDLRVQMVHFETQVRGRCIVARLSLVEFDGAPIRALARRAEIQSRILSVIEPRSRVRRSRRPALLTQAAEPS